MTVISAANIKDVNAFISEISFCCFSDYIALIKMEGKFVQLSRNFSLSRSLLASMNEPLKTVHSKHDESINLWKKLFFFGALPATVLSLINVKLSEEPPRPEFVKYPHLRLRNKPFPWKDGVKTLFHNPHVNALPDGYEDDGH